MGWFSKKRKLRRVEPGDGGYAAVLAAVAFPPGTDRDAAAAKFAARMQPDTEHYVYDGEDGRPAGVATLTPLAAGTVEAWIAVDPVLRHFGTGDAIFELVCGRARKLRATTLLASATHPDGVIFLAKHGFKALPPEAAAADGARADDGRPGKVLARGRLAL